MADEVKGEGNSVNYKYRMHDPRIGRFFAVDPLAAQYPFYTPYAFSGNRVNDAIELEGLEPFLVVNNDVFWNFEAYSGENYAAFLTSSADGHDIIIERVLTDDEIQTSASLTAMDYVN